MITSLGKQLRIIRLNHGELLKDMADKLGITPAYLSSIENGKRTPPRTTVNEIISLYNLNQAESVPLIDSYAETLMEVSIQLNDTTNQQKELGLVFARRFNSLSEDEISQILKTLNGKKEV